MKTQGYQHHRHVPVLTIVGAIFFLVAVAGLALRWFGIGGRWAFAVGLGGMLAGQFVLLLISREYVTALQDRIIKLEMRVRCGALLTPAQQEALWSLETAQLVALRFASDAELGMLVERAARERLTADQIKRAIANWVADWDRT